MPKIGPNKVSVDPKAYAARITRAKKIVESMDPATRQKIKDMYPEKAAMKKKTAPMKPTVSRAPSKGVKKPMPKMEGAKPGVKKLMPKVTSKPKPLTGPAAVAEIQRRTSPAGVKKAEMDAKKATNKKYPGLYKKSK